MQTEWAVLAPAPGGLGAKKGVRWEHRDPFLPQLKRGDCPPAHPFPCRCRQMRVVVYGSQWGSGAPLPAPATHPTPFLSRQAGMRMRGRGGCNFTSPMGKESARHFFSTIHQARTGPSSDLPKPLPGVHAQRHWRSGWSRESLEVCLGRSAP